MCFALDAHPEERGGGMKKIIVACLIFAGIGNIICGMLSGDRHSTIIGMLTIILSNQIMDQN